VFDLLDEVPEEQRRDAFITRPEKLVLVVEEDLEVRRERRLDNGGVRQSPGQRSGGGQVVIGSDHCVLGLLQARPALDQCTQVADVRSGMLGLLTEISLGLLDYLGIAYQRNRLSRGIDDELLETWREERNHVALHGERRPFRLPIEWDVGAREIEPDSAHL
jgi:hypothetical protein